MLAHRAALPSVVAAFGDLKRLAEYRDGVLLRVLRNERKGQSWLREKMPSAFFNMSRSCRVTSSSRLRRRSSSSCWVWWPLPGNACSPCSENSLHQWCRVLSAMPRSRAIWAIDFPLVFTNCTASCLNSFVKVRCAFCMIFPFLVQVHFFKFTFPTFLGQDQKKPFRQEGSEEYGTWTSRVRE